MVLAKRLWIRHAVWVCLCIGLVTAVGACGWPGQRRPALGPFDPPPEDLKNHQEAVDLYLAGNFEDAANRFFALGEQTGHSTIARMASYGLACSRLMAAETPRAHHEALAIWNAWMSVAPTPRAYEDPRLVAPIIRNKMLFSHLPVDPGGGEADPTGPTVPKWILVQAEQALRDLKAQLDSAGQRVREKEHRIKTLEQEVDRLNQQIEAFEKIDQKIQQKKSAIPSTD